MAAIKYGPSIQLLCIKAGSTGLLALQLMIVVHFRGVLDHCGEAVMDFPLILPLNNSKLGGQKNHAVQSIWCKSTIYTTATLPPYIASL